MSNLPAMPPENAGIEELRAALRSLILWANEREPLADGGTLDKFLTAGQAVEQGLLIYAPGASGTGPSGDSLSPGAGTGSDPYDSSAPTGITGLAAAQGVSHYLITWDSPNYLQGGGNGRTIIYAANYSGAGPLPTFGDAVEIGAAPGKAVILVIAGEPGVIKHFWAKAETRYPTLQASPSGGLNGVTATADLIEDQHVLNLTAAKLLAGEIAVSEYIRSAGYTGSGISEWSIGGDGVARFTGVIVSGTVTATAGSFANVTIAGALTMNTSGHVKGGQTAYNTGTGFFLGYDGAAYKFSIGNGTLGLLWDGSALTINGGGTFSGALSAATGSFSGTLTVGTTPAVSGTTMTGTGGVINSGGTFALGNSTTNINFNGTVLTLNGAVVTEANLNLGAFTLAVDDSSVTGSGTSPVDISQAVEVTPSGSTGTITYVWSLVTVTVVNNGSAELYLSGDIFSDALTVGARVTGAGSSVAGYAICTATDANGRTAQVAVTLSADETT